MPGKPCCGNTSIQLLLCPHLHTERCCRRVRSFTVSSPAVYLPANQSFVITGKWQNQYQFIKGAGPGRTRSTHPHSGHNTYFLPHSTSILLAINENNHDYGQRVKFNWFSFQLCRGIFLSSSINEQRKQKVENSVSRLCVYWTFNDRVKIACCHQQQANTCDGNPVKVINWDKANEYEHGDFTPEPLG